jgi:hypothetical protein
LTSTGALTGVQVGQRILSNTAGAAFPDGTFVSSISADRLTVLASQALTGSTPATSVTFVPMGAASAQSFSYSSTAPTAVELAYPTFAPTISHWGTSVIMDGRFDDDKSLLFTYGQSKQTGLVPVGTTMPTGITAQTTSGINTRDLNVSTDVGIVIGMSIAGTNIPANTIVLNKSGTGTSTILTLSNLITVAVASTTALTFTGATAKALMSIRVAPSVDNGIAAAFGSRDLINRMQLVLKALGISMLGSGNILVTLILNGTPSGAIPWTNAVGNVSGSITSSLAQIADYGGGAVFVTGGEVTGGFFVNGTDRLELNEVRDLGNAIQGGGGANSNTQIYPDGPDVATVYVSNVGTTGVAVLGRLSWTEAQA